MSKIFVIKESLKNILWVAWRVFMGIYLFVNASIPWAESCLWGMLLLEISWLKKLGSGFIQTHNQSFFILQGTTRCQHSSNIWNQLKFASNFQRPTKKQTYIYIFKWFGGKTSAEWSKAYVASQAMIFINLAHGDIHVLDTKGAEQRSFFLSSPSGLLFGKMSTQNSQSTLWD